MSNKCLTLKHLAFDLSIDGYDGEGILIFGHGTLSGDRLPHSNFANPPLPDDEHWRYHGINIEGNH